jgi:hypothetical protein
MSCKVPFVEYGKSYLQIKKEVLPEINRVLSQGKLILQEDVEKFEKKLASYCATKYAVGLNSGTDALVLALKALGIGKGDEVITTGYTFWATVESIINVGAKPVLCDIGEDLLIDISSIAGKITNKTKAIIPVHIGGARCNMEEIMKIAKKNNLKVIEDSAQGLGTGKPLGDIQTYSFYPAKVLGCYGDGGAITTNDEELYNKIILLRNHGGKPHPVLAGHNSRLDNLQAAILNIKIKHLNKMIKRRREIAKIYNKELGFNTKSITFQEYNYRTDDRDGLYNFLKENGIETIKGDYGFPLKVPKECQVANESILRLPIWTTLSDKQIKYVCKKINEYKGR